MEAVGQVAAQMPARQWLPQPDTTTAPEEADLRLVAGAAENGVLIGREPLALAVPFTHPWTEKSWTDAQDLNLPPCPAPPITNPCWLPWRLLRPPLKAVPLDGLLPFEPGYPAQQSWSLVGAEPEAATLLAPLLRPFLAPAPLVSLAAVGDLMLDRSLGYRLTLGDVDVPFVDVADTLRAADLTVGNLESALGDVGEPVQKSYRFQAPPIAAESLARAGFDILSLANNHALDFGVEALQQGIGLLLAQEITPIGAGADRAAAHAPALHTVNGVRVAFLAYANVPVEGRGFDTRSWEAGPDRAGLAWGDPEQIAADVAAARRQADVVVVLLHSGIEYQAQPWSAQMAAAQAAVDAGTQLVIGHHAHILQGVQFAPTGVIAYGLGNFAFEIDGPPETAILRVWLDEEGVKMLTFVPAFIQFGGAPRLATPAEAAAIQQQIEILTLPLNP